MTEGEAAFHTVRTNSLFGEGPPVQHGAVRYRKVRCGAVRYVDVQHSASVIFTLKLCGVLKVRLGPTSTVPYRVVGWNPLAPRVHRSLKRLRSCPPRSGQRRTGAASLIGQKWLSDPLGVLRHLSSTWEQQALGGATVGAPFGFGWAGAG